VSVVAAFVGEVAKGVLTTMGQRLLEEDNQVRLKVVFAGYVSSVLKIW